MARPLERDIERRVCKYAKAKYGWDYKKQQGQGDRGKADRYFLNTNGRIVFIEFKRPGSGLTILQERELNRLRRKEFIAVGIDNVEDGEWFFDNLDSGFFTVDRLKEYPLMVADFPQSGQ